ncbi:hypothetical protein SS50377_21978 [Spironucleus salmonicida]|uniref:Uncharacterized protein n=1 Tax=Spironucleus salmonicida TaxID=348837 RepID=V6LTJ5_9EUKA|nr:hypothetical protein SS50377_21978 [Spironucleus salmonicida]|eukprot:EST47016.1 Hypothetical protein SS50377_12972 [Spironucleus salmonicida]
MGCGSLNTYNIDNSDLEHSGLINIATKIDTDDLMQQMALKNQLNIPETRLKVASQLFSVILNQTYAATEIGSSNIFNDDNSDDVHHCQSMISGDVADHQLPLLYVLDNNIIQADHLQTSRINMYTNIIIDAAENGQIDDLVQQQMRRNPLTLSNLFK